VRSSQVENGLGRLVGSAFPRKGTPEEKSDRSERRKGSLEEEALAITGNSLKSLLALMLFAGVGNEGYA
jgi:hypothetical protein